MLADIGKESSLLNASPCFLSLSAQTPFCSCLQLNLSSNSIGYDSDSYDSDDGYDSDGDEVTKLVAGPKGVQAIADALRVSGSLTEVR